jgi:hypothetical protein
MNWNGKFGFDRKSEIAGFLTIHALSIPAFIL